MTASGVTKVIESEIVSQRENVGEVGEPSTGLLLVCFSIDILLTAV